MIKLTAQQKRMIAQQDNTAKNAFLSEAPAINNAGVKAHQKYQSYADSLHNANKAVVAKA
jgi:hypothetical protein